MTINATPSEVSYVGDDVSVSFPIPFPFDDAADLKVIETDIASGVPSTVTTGFAISGGAGSPGVLTRSPALPSTKTLTILDNPALTQPVDYTPNDAFPAETHEKALDRCVRQIKRLSQQLARALRFADGDPITDATLGSVDARKGKYPFFNAVTGAVEYVVAIATTVLSQSVIADLLYPQTLAESAAAVVPTNKQYLPGDVRRYGAVLDGTTDDTAALRKWLLVGGDLTWPVAATAKITGDLPMVSNTTIRAARGATIQTATHDISFLTASSKTNISVRGLHFKQTGVGSTPYVAAVKLTSCTDCSVSECEFEGMQWSGVMLNKASRCVVENNYFHSFLGTAIQDNNDVCCYEDASYNIIVNNRLYGGGGLGVLIQDPYTSNKPTKNLVKGNRVGAHTEYGIAVYMPNAIDSFNSIIGNFVENVSGSFDTTLYGSGIYVVGAGAGGAIVQGNNVTNCCTATTGTTNAPAGISITGLSATGAPVVVDGNVVQGMTKYCGIWAATNAGLPLVIANNAVSLPSSNTTGEGIRAEDSSSTALLGNNVQLGTTRRGILVYANQFNVSDVIVSNNIVSGGGDRQIEFLLGTHTFARATITGNILHGCAAAKVAMYLDTIAQATIASNIIAGSDTYALFVNALTSARFANNVLSTSGAVGFGAGGTCTNSYFDKTNLPGGLIENQGTGLICEQFGSSAPASASSYAKVGDRVEQSVPVVGNPKGWRATVAGNPGTWVSEGNL